MWAIALMSFAAGALAVAFYPYTAARKAVKSVWKFMCENYKLIWLFLYAAYFIWCVIHEHRTGRFGGEGIMLIIIPFIGYLIEHKIQEKRRKE